MSTLSTFNAFTHLERLLKDFRAHAATSEQLSSPNREDDEFIRCAMVGFACHVPLERWSVEQFRWVSARKDEALHGEFPLDWIRFTCLAAGYFLGMAEAGQMTEADLMLAEAHTPGFMWLHSNVLWPTGTT